MIRIYKDNDNKLVTKGAFEQIYKPLGYNIILDVVEGKVEEQIDEKVIDKPMENETVIKPKRVSSSRKNKRERN